MKRKVVSYRGSFYNQLWCNEHHNVYYITSKEEFIKVIWNLVQHLGLYPIGMGSWNQDGAKEWFFDQGYSSYLMRGSVKDFNGEDWYIFEYDKRSIYDEDVIFIIKLEDIREKYHSFMSQFAQ